MAHNHKILPPNLLQVMRINFVFCSLPLTYLSLLSKRTPRRARLFEKLSSLTKELGDTKFLFKFYSKKGVTIPK